MIRTKEVREKLSLTRIQIHLYRKAGLFPYEPIAVSHGGLWRDRVYPEEALTVLEVLEGLRQQGFGLKAMRVLFHTMAVGEGTRGFIAFDEKARIVIAPERLSEARQVIEAVVRSYNRGYNLPPRGKRPRGKG
ncbi:hypothetical protein ES708_19793 [subsurface metagenome]